MEGFQHKENGVRTERESWTGSKYELYMARALTPAPAETQPDIYWDAREWGNCVHEERNGLGGPKGAPQETGEKRRK